MLTHIKPCPWCGHQPERYYLQDGKEYVGCMNRNCPVNPITPAYSTKGCAMRVWNSRNEDKK